MMIEYWVAGIESLRSTALMDTAPAAISNSLSTSAASSSSNQTLPPPSTSSMLTALSTVTRPSVLEPTMSTSNSLPSTITSSVSQASKPRKKSVLLKTLLNRK
ncbi:hypothetical protein TNCV_179801 [Trichonephila clavipes]|nr:hypothetical protein TNCV_179801 [Trichonephila clavipes]